MASNSPSHSLSPSLTEDYTKDDYKKGYPKEVLVNIKLEQKYLCVLCNLVLRNPVQCFCGHRFCDLCLKHLLSTSSGEVSCPECEQEGMVDDSSDLKQTFPDNAIKREFNKMDAKCINEGCSWTGTFKNYQQHESACEYRIVTCECGQDMTHASLDHHQKENCTHRILICPFCNSSIIAHKIEFHHNKECPSIPMKCLGCNKEGFTRDQLLVHQDLDKGDCEARDKICPLNCPNVVEGSLEDHMSKYAGTHVLILQSKISRLEKKVGSGSSPAQIEADSEPVAGSGPNPHLTEINHKIMLLEKLLKDQQHQHPQQLPGSLFKSTSEGKLFGGATGGVPADDVTATGSAQRGEPDGALSEVKTKITATDAKVNSFEDSLAIIFQQLNAYKDEICNLQQVQREMRGGTDALGRQIKSLEQTVKLKDATIAETQLKLQDLIMTTYDGILVWKITDFSKKRNEAKSGRSLSIYSPPFYTSKTGYKMCCRLYPNGDGMGKNKYLSLFFVVMQGQFDALLKWPFRQKVTMMLMDHNNQEHIIDAFRPDPNSSSFRFPTSNMNVASGCPLFCTQAQLDHQVPAYLKDDTIFIKIIVDTTDL